MKNLKELINLIFKAVGLAMGIAVTVLCIIQKIEINSAIVMIGIGLTSLGISFFTVKNEDNNQH